MKAGHITVEAREGGMLARTESTDRIAVDFDLASADTDGLGDAVRGLFAAPALEGARFVDLLLHTPLAQTRTLVDLPRVRPRDLLALVENQRFRFFRPVGGDAVIAAQWVDGDDSAVARAAMVRLELLQRLESAFDRNGLAIREVLPVFDSNELGPPLLTPTARRRERRRRLETGLVAIGIATAGWMIAGMVYLSDLMADERLAVSELAQLEEPLRRMEALRSRVADFAPMAEAVQRQSGSSAALLMQLAGLAEALPVDSHLHRLANNPEGGMTVEAHGPDALAVVERLDAWWPGSARLDGSPQPDSTGLDGSAGERFTVVLGPKP